MIFVKKAMLLVALLFCAAYTSAQSVETVQINGENYHVYPFRVKVNIHNDYWIAVKDKEFYADYNNYFNVFNGGKTFNREKFKNPRNEKTLERLQKKLKKRWKNLRKHNGRWSIGPKFVRTVRKNPHPLLSVTYSRTKDVLPPFESIPDGKYVQLFEEFCMVDKKGNCQPQIARVAGYFTIKNNALEGEAIWLDTKGDTLKKGNYINGIRQGSYEHISMRPLSRRLYKWSLKPYKKKGYLRRDTTFYKRNYVNGLREGESIELNPRDKKRTVGHFREGKATGSWMYWEDNVLVDQHVYANVEDTIVTKKPLIRTGELIYMPRYHPDFDTRPDDYDLLNCPDNFYTVMFKVSEDIELEGENNRSHEITDARNSYTSGRYNSGLYARATEKLIRDPNSGKLFSQAKLIDSLGLRMKYDGIYELRYPNGGLFMRYVFENGELVEEDTIFWDNGVPHDVITKIPDSNYYLRTVYDYKGKKYKGLLYDSLGTFVKYDAPQKRERAYIEGYSCEINHHPSEYNYLDGPTSYTYANWDTLRKNPIEDETVLYRAWSGDDSTLQKTTIYNPTTRSIHGETYSITGKIIETRHHEFTEDYEGWTGFTTARMGEFVLKCKESGVVHERRKNDTLPSAMAGHMYSWYDFSEDYRLSKGSELFSGDVVVKRNTRKSYLKDKGGKLKVGVSRNGFLWKWKVRRKIKAYKKHGKNANNYELNASENGDGPARLSSQAFNEMMYPLFRPLVKPNKDARNYYYGDMPYNMKRIEGHIEEGRAHGVWTMYDRKGNVMATVNFVNGNPDGEMRRYAYQNKLRRHYFGYNEAPLDTFPKKKTYYMNQSIMYENGQREGHSVDYIWTGRPTVDVNYKNDLEHGRAFYDDFDSYTEANFREGALDGYLKTYLTLPYEDTSLLYDLNFQDGALSGESKSYHLNGNLAKRGFFLDGDPIEDYEAYDTLGFKYHYVKFKYSFPVEEKIWEENELSIRYKFNWEDSIFFSPRDFVNSQSLERMLSQKGYRRRSLQEAYYGRPRLVEKAGVECHMTKYYPNDTIARIGLLKDNKKLGLWKFYNYDGLFLYEVDYFDTIIRLNDTLKFKSKGIMTDYDDEGNELYKAHIIEKFEKYDCAHTDHYEIRQFYVISETSDSVGRMNGYVQNFYDNGTIQSEGYMKDGLPSGFWKYYDPFGKLNKVGNYVNGKRNGRWLEGDLSKKKYLGEICMNPNLPDLEKEKKYQENLLDITILNYRYGTLLNAQFYDINMNRVMEIEENRTSSR